jgi:hypothetical protein
MARSPIHTIPRSGTYFLKNVLKEYTGNEKSIDLVVHGYMTGEKANDTIEKAKNIMSFGKDSILSDIKFVPNDEKTVFIYRNPLDQAVSFYDHFYSNWDLFPGVTQRSHKSAFGMCKTPTEVALKYIGTYSCMYLSHFDFKKSNPERIIIFSYEEMMRDVLKIMGKIIKFLIGELDEPKLINSLERCTPSLLQDREIEMGITLARDMKYKKGKSHIKDGKIGKWRERIDMSSLNEIIKQYSKFGINIMEFDGIKQFELRYWKQLCEKYNYIPINDIKIENYNFCKE